MIASACYEKGPHFVNATVNKRDRRTAYKVEFSPTNFFAFVNDGVFTNVQCNENICVASGTYVSDVPQSTPLLAQSKDKGVTWIYPNQITDVYFLPDNPYAFQDGGIFHGSAGGQNAPFLPNSLKFLKPDLTSKHARPVPLR